MNWPEFRRTFENWWIPPRCVVSGGAAESVDLSAEVLGRFRRADHLCPQCGQSSQENRLCGRCLQVSNNLNRTQVGWFFSGPVMELIHGLKYGDQYAYGRLIAELWAPLLEVEGVELLLPVPIHPARRRDRGYNQAAVLARNLGKHLGIAVCEQAVQRTRNTPSQTNLSRRQRQTNLKRAFSVKGEYLAGVRKVALIDDVITTGATMQNLAAAVRAASQIEVIQAWAPAKTE